MTTNTESFDANSTGLFLSNSTVDFAITKPTLPQVESGNYYLSSNSQWQLVGIVAGTNTQVQFNDSGSLGANNDFTFDVLTTKLNLGNSTVNAFANSLSFVLANSTVTFSITKPTPGQSSSGDYYLASDSTWKQVTAGGNAAPTTPAGSNTFIQFNESGSFGANILFTFDRATTTLAVGANVFVNAIAVSVGNTTANLLANSILVKVANSTGIANLQPTQLVIGTSTVNSTVYSAGANVILGTVDLRIGNSTVNAMSNSIAVVLANSTVTFTISRPTAAQVADTNYYLSADSTWKQVTVGGGNTSPAGANTQVQFNASGSFGANSLFTFDEATSKLGIGANVFVNTIAISVGNSTANLLANSIIVKVANSTSTANLTPLGFFAGTSVVNTTVIAAGANVLVGTADLRIGNSTVNAMANSLQIALANSTVTLSIIKPSAAQVTAANYYLASDSTWKQVSGSAQTLSKKYERFTATDAQVDFAIAGGVNGALIDVFYNGIHLANNEWTSNATHIQLTVGANSGAIVEISGFILT